MALNIKNLKVSVSVNQARSDGGEGSSTPNSEQGTGKKTDAEKIAKDVVEQIIQIMNNKTER